MKQNFAENYGKELVGEKIAATVFTVKYFVLGLFLIMFCCINVSAQQNTAGNILEVSAFLSSLSQENSAGKNTESNAASHVKKLITNVQSSVYLTNGTVQTYGESPVALYTDTNSLNSITSADIKRSNIEIITVYVNEATDLADSVNTAIFTGFPNLKYVYIISNVVASDAAIIQMVQNSNIDYSVFYKIAKGA